MDIDASTRLGAPTRTVFAALEDLGTYPGWLTIVSAAEPSDPVEGDPGPAWDVELTARFGPLSRTKRLRMVRTVHEPDRGEVRFERREADGVEHNAWVLAGQAEPGGDVDGEAGTQLSLHLHYGGASRLPGMDVILRQEADKAGPRLEALLDER